MSIQKIMEGTKNEKLCENKREDILRRVCQESNLILRRPSRWHYRRSHQEGDEKMRYVGGTFCDPVIEEDDTIFDEMSQDEILEMKVKEHLEEEENLLREIKYADSQRSD